MKMNFRKSLKINSQTEIINYKMKLNTILLFSKFKFKK